MGVLGPKLSSTRLSASEINARRIGTLSQKIDGQEMPCTTAPLSSGNNRSASRTGMPRFVAVSC
jgi:hypothetical protein